MRPVAGSSKTADAVTAAGPVTVNTDELIVLGSIRWPDGTLNVAFTVALVQTFRAEAAGLVDSTVMLAAETAAAGVADVVNDQM